MQTDLPMCEHFNRIFVKYFGSNMDAVRMCNDLVYAAHLWDDLYDQDKPRSKAAMNKAFTILWGILPTNPFFQEHVRELGPIMMNAVLKWQNANEMERSENPNTRLCAFFIRSCFVDAFTYCLYLIGGYGYALQAGPKMWADLGSDIIEKYNEFEKEMTAGRGSDGGYRTESGEQKAEAGENPPAVEGGEPDTVKEVA